MGLYALYGGVAGAVSRLVLGVVGDDSGGLAGYKGEEEEEEEDGGYQILCKIYYSCVVRVRRRSRLLSPALPPPRRRGGGVWLRTPGGYGAAWRPHLLESRRGRLRTRALYSTRAYGLP